MPRKHFDVLNDTLTTANVWQKILLPSWTQGWMVQCRTSVDLDLSLLPGHRRWWTLRGGSAHGELGNATFFWARSTVAGVVVETVVWGDQDAAAMGIAVLTAGPVAKLIGQVSPGVYAELLVQSALTPNLRTAIYSGATGPAPVTALSTNQVDADVGLTTRAIVYGRDVFTALYRRIEAQEADDGQGPFIGAMSLQTASFVYNFEPLSGAPVIDRGLVKRTKTLLGPNSTDAISINTVSGLSKFSLQVNNSGAAANWTVILEGSNDNITWTTLLTHTDVAPGNGQIVFPAAGISTLVQYLRVRRTADGGGGTVTAIYIGRA